MHNRKRRAALLALTLLVVALAGILRWRAVLLLPPDFDELVYLPVSFRYEEMLASGKWKQIENYEENTEHPPLNKLLFATELWACHPAEPNWKALDVGNPMPAEARPAFRGPRAVSAAGGTLQVLLVAVTNPLAGLLLALDTYHIKYSAQVYLEGVPGFLSVLAVFLFELGFARKRGEASGAAGTGAVVDRQPPSLPILVGSAASLGLAAAGKYLYGIVGFVLLAFLIYRTRSVRLAALYCLAALGLFFAANPFLWPNPGARLWNSVTYHWQYSHGKHVVESGLPWYAPVVYLVRSLPTAWHRGVFITGGVADHLILPLALIGIPRAFRERRIWLAWAGFGLLFLFVWATKWPQYILMILPPLCVCAACGIRSVAALITNKARA